MYVNGHVSACVLSCPWCNVKYQIRKTNCPADRSLPLPSPSQFHPIYGQIGCVAKMPQVGVNIEYCVTKVFSFPSQSSLYSISSCSMEEASCSHDPSKTRLQN